MFVGYAREYKAWKFYDPAAKTYIISRMALFNERVGDSTPTLTLLKQPQPEDLEISQLQHMIDKHDDDKPPHTHDSMPSTPKTDSVAAADRSKPTTRSITAASRAPPSGSHDADADDPAIEGRKVTTGTDTIAPPSAPPCHDSTTDSNAVRWMPTPYDNMTVQKIARYFNVDATSYRGWLVQFSPFGPGEAMAVAPPKSKKPTRFAKGTDVRTTNSLTSSTH